VSFSIGGDDNATTLPNFMKQFTPTLVGQALGKLWHPQMHHPCTGDDIENTCRLSSAFDGASIQQLIQYQVDYLNTTLRTAKFASKVDVDKDWKLITIFSGLDDAVFAYPPYAKPYVPRNASLLEADLDELLTRLKAAFPKKLFVNVIGLPVNFDPNVTQ